MHLTVCKLNFNDKYKKRLKVKDPSLINKAAAY